eukprot:CAMPEP_0172008078 /NCGR_PEP_ID=MMETSP1041-20130122/6462_1 /TAXON_ID=464988 /ORGANISM="Hemiselmis andersenii, Strain CCMP439" /LENGTH=96 /DNA_ID=CAMNT_0012662263 /DNA_START=636 /DNA_END=926 /DNA_ORIENTATION=-
MPPTTAPHAYISCPRTLCRPSASRGQPRTLAGLFHTRQGAACITHSPEAAADSSSALGAQSVAKLFSKSEDDYPPVEPPSGFTQTPTKPQRNKGEW